MKKDLLTKKKYNWVRNRNVVLRGERLSYNASLQLKYKTKLENLVIKMTKETERELKKLFKSETSENFFEKQKEVSAMDSSIASKAKILMNKLTKKFNQLFSLKSKLFANSMVIGQSNASKSNLHNSLKKLSGGLSLKTGVVPKGMEEIATASVAENVSLIKSIPEQYFKDITGSVMRSITSGNGYSDLMKDIKKYNGQTERRAKNLALDQTRKAYNSINKQRLLSLGVKKFEWIHSGGSQFPRESHIKIDGHIFSFENLESEQAALGVPKEDRGIPGYPVNCKCTMNPVIDFDEDED